nr:ABC transporter permease subunit [Aliamphritea spongicola]
MPDTVREAATAFGASKWFLLFKVDIPLAMPSIMAGINQTILMCLSMVVIASLIGAKGLGKMSSARCSTPLRGKGDRRPGHFGMRHGARPHHSGQPE